MDLRHVTLVLLLVVGTVVAGPARADPPPHVALLPLVGQGLGTDEIARVEKTLQTEVDARFGLRSVPSDQVRARLDAGSAKGLKCDREEVDCAVQLGIVARADQVITASLSPKGAAVELALRLVDVGNGEQLAFTAGPVTAEPTGDEVRALLESLDQPQARSTRVIVQGPSGALVLLDGNTLGTLPLMPLEDIAPGKHTLAIIGTLRHDRTIDLRRGEPIVVDAPTPAPLLTPTQHVVDVTPPPSSEPSALPWVGVAGGGAGVVLGGAALAFGMWPKLAYDDAAAHLHRIEVEVGADHAALVERQDEVTKTRKQLDDSEANWTSWGAPLAIAGGVVLGVGVVVAGAGAFGLVE